EAERNRRARIIDADAEFQAAKKIAEAAGVLYKEKGGMFIRTLQTIKEATEEKATTVLIPFPIEMLTALGYRSETRSKSSEETTETRD
ncbi:MAG: slipin family protein, partial [Methanophagales archaeon]|nr:slipin family protein [Methanophagales archaeon]